MIWSSSYSQTRPLRIANLKALVLTFSLPRLQNPAQELACRALRDLIHEFNLYQPFVAYFLILDVLHLNSMLRLHHFHGMRTDYRVIDSPPMNGTPLEESLRTCLSWFVDNETRQRAYRDTPIHYPYSGVGDYAEDRI